MYGNFLRHNENGGLINNNEIERNVNNNFFYNVKLGNTLGFEPNPFSTTVKVGNIYKDNGSPCGALSSATTIPPGGCVNAVNGNEGNKDPGE